MKKLFKPSDFLLLGLAGLFDVFEEARDPFGIRAYGCKTMYGWIPQRYKRHNFVRLVQKQLKTGNIEKKIKNGQAYLRLTSTGQDKIKRDFPLISLQKQKWDRKWRIVVFDIAEISRRSRDILRAKLKKLGFGMFQKSVWVTPHDITQDFTEFIQSRGLAEQVYIIEGNRLLAGKEKALAERIWHLDKLNENYKNLLIEIKKWKQMYVTTHDRKHLPTFENVSGVDKELIAGFQQMGENKSDELKRKYLEFLLKDPFLPKELLPDDWLGEEVKKEIGKI
ncbi:MAG: hypothetical protein M1120_03015 [Patescibacteria group bacterium]|nr:hypothetical protein [Patescibacteria group bacterium]